MGFFSWNCRGCGHPLLSAYSMNSINVWMVNAIAITKRGCFHTGDYDGYGNVGGANIAGGVRYGKTGVSRGDPDCYHHKCWQILGEPKGYKGGSTSARDQGYFFDKQHDIPEPKTRADLVKAKRIADANERAEAKAAAEFQRQWKKEHPELCQQQEQSATK